MENPIPSGINRYTKPKGFPPEELAKITFGDTHTVKSYINLEVIKHFISDYTRGEIRTFLEMIRPQIKRLEDVILKFIEIKKVMKIKMKLNLIAKNLQLMMALLISS